METNEPKRERSERRREDEQPSPMPRSVKYAWGIGLTVLVALSMVVDRSSPFMPLIHRAIDALQIQTAPIENK